MFQTDDGLAIVGTTLRDVGVSRAIGLSPCSMATTPPYQDLGRTAVPASRALRRRPVFITARFRSGSTLLWNIFRHVNGCTSYYEPLNERRWFDVTFRGTKTDVTHRNVNDYWHEYNALEELGRYYREDWIRRRLFMDASSWDPNLSAYIRTLIDRAEGRAVLQFNRVDFRLPWLRHTFPEATILHLYRHPRDQWCSSLVDPSACPLTCDISAFIDHFYLLPWAADLKHQFPFLDPADVEHPYQLFYFIWKLSYLFGAAYADYSIAFETLVADPEVELQRLFRAAEIEVRDLRPLTELVVPTPSHWMRYASADWFRGHEERCEAVLTQFFGTSMNPQPRPEHTIHDHRTTYLEFVQTMETAQPISVAQGSATE